MDQDLKDKITNIVSNEVFIKKAEVIVTSVMDKKLQFDEEGKFMAEDQIHNIYKKLLLRIENGDKIFEPGTASIPIEENIMKHPISKYFITSLKHECFTRRSYRSMENSKGKKGARARYKPGELSQNIIDSRSDESSDINLSQIDTNRVKKLLVQKGLSERDIEIIWQRLEGKRFVEMAREYGGSPDKYRKRYSRALKKANIDRDVFFL